MIGGRITGTIVELLSVPEGKLFRVHIDDTELFIEFPPDMIGYVNDPVHHAAHKFIELAKSRRKHLVLVGKIRKGGFARIIADSYEELNQKRDDIDRINRRKRNPDVTWKWLFEVNTSEQTPTFITPPAGPSNIQVLPRLESRTPPESKPQGRPGKNSLTGGASSDGSVIGSAPPPDAPADHRKVSDGRPRRKRIRIQRPPSDLDKGS